MENQNERELVRRCVEGEEAAWEEFLRRFGPLLRHAVRETCRIRRVPLSAGEEDELYTALLEHWIEDRFRRLRLFRWHTPFPVYLVIVSRRAVVDVLRKEGFRRALHEKAGRISFRDTSSSPEDPAIREELRERMTSALARLDPATREMVRLAFLEEKSYREISRLLKIPRATVGWMLQQAKETLRQILRSHLLI